MCHSESSVGHCISVAAHVYSMCMCRHVYMYTKIMCLEHHGTWRNKPIASMGHIQCTCTCIYLYTQIHAHKKTVASVGCACIGYIHVCMHDSLNGLENKHYFHIQCTCMYTQQTNSLRNNLLIHIWYVFHTQVTVMLLLLWLLIQLQNLISSPLPG